MKVLKFGGTSVGSPESLRNVRSIIESQTDSVIVTVSALGGVTNRLIDLAAKSADGDYSFESVFEEIRSRHSQVIAQVIEPEQRQHVMHTVMGLMDELYTVCRALFLLRELTPRSLDLVESYGERMSVAIVTSMLSCAVAADALDLIRTLDCPGRTHMLDAQATAQRIHSALDGRTLPPVTVIGGFIARDNSGRISNLGRGGSDYTAAIIAAELHADILEIWTDVDGFMTADPRRVSSAKVIDRLSFLQAMELCMFGAKVVYPPTIYPVFNADIPILIKNTFNPDAPGTLISSAEATSHGRATGISATPSIALVELSGADTAQSQRIINTLARCGIETLLPDSAGHCAVNGHDAQAARQTLAEEFAAELASGAIGPLKVTEGLSLIAAVGIADPTPLTDAFAGQGILSFYHPNGTAACIVEDKHLDTALNTAHSLFITRQP